MSKKSKGFAVLTVIFLIAALLTQCKGGEEDVEHLALKGTKFRAIDVDHDASVGGALSVTGATTVGGALTVSGATTFTTLDLNGNELTLDADADTSLTADTDDQIDIEIGGADVAILKDWTATALTNTTEYILEIADTTGIGQSGTNAQAALNIDMGIGNSTAGTNSIYGILIDTIVSDAQNTEDAIAVGSGWDYAADFDAGVTIDGGMLNVGTGVCGVANGDNDVCIAAVLEVDGEAEFDGAIDADSTSDFADTMTLSKGSGTAALVAAGGTFSLPATADISAFGYINVGDGTPNGAVTAGTDEQLYVEGAVEIDGELNADGAINADSTSDFAGTATFSKGSGNAIMVSAGGTVSLPATADLCAYGYANVGDGTPDGSVTAGTDEQLYVEGAFEVDGEAEFDGAIDADSTSDFAGTATFSKGSGNAILVSAGGTVSLPATADISAFGYVNVGDGTPDGSVTAGTNEQLYVEGAMEVDGELEADGAIDADSTLNVAGAVTFQGAFYSSFTDLAVSDGQTITPTYTTYALDTTGNVTITLAASAQEGQLLVLINDDANATIIADTNLRSSDGNAITMAGAYDVAMFVYQDAEWLAIAVSADS